MLHALPISSSISNIKNPNKTTYCILYTLFYLTNTYIMQEYNMVYLYTTVSITYASTDYVIF